jgi:hypothetical protein
MIPKTTRRMHHRTQHQPRQLRITHRPLLHGFDNDLVTLREIGALRTDAFRT